MRTVNDCIQCMKVFSEYVLSCHVMTFGAETSTLPVGLVHKLEVAQRAIELAMLRVSLEDKINNEIIWRRTGVINIVFTQFCNLQQFAITILYFSELWGYIFFIRLSSLNVYQCLYVTVTVFEISNLKKQLKNSYGQK